MVEKLSVPRCLKAPVTTDIERCELHLFSDASENAFAAVAYARFTDADNQKHTSLIMSKSRLAPLKQISIVRLELQAAVLATRLATTIHRELNYEFDETVFWTDSQVVLQFISSESRTFNTFVANRVSEIQDSTQSSQWRHVPGLQNPADIGSRGMPASRLGESELWWHGPAFLKEDCNEWPSLHIPGLSAEIPELKRSVETPAVGFVGDPAPRLVDPSRFSSWSRYRRVVAWVRRFTVNARARSEKNGRMNGPLTVEELLDAEAFIIAEDQSRQTIDTPQGLSLFRDDRGVFRVKGRLASAPLAEVSQTPVVLSPDSEVTKLIISDLHAKVLHSGVGHTLNQFRQKYWAPKARSVVKKVLHTCMYCRNRRSKPSPPKMADLPKERFDTSRPFMSVGLDYLGPLYVKKFRRTEKRYVLLVTCLATRAIHLEVAYSMDMDSFLMAFRRFVARRGSPAVVFSDNGSNLVAGEKELRQSLEEWNQNHLSDALAQDGIQWKFNPPTASHMGGIWERLVASVKRALRVVLGDKIVTDDVLHTVLTEVEYVFNSRPLTYVSGAANEPEAITPNHFLLKSGSTSALPPGVFGDEEVMSRKRWRQTQALTNQVWRRWMREYIPTLIARKRWNTDTCNVAVGDVVLLVSEDSPRGHWPLGVVDEAYPSQDGVVRSALVRTSSGSYRRPCTKICVLEKRSQKKPQSA